MSVFFMIFLAFMEPNDRKFLKMIIDYVITFILQWLHPFYNDYIHFAMATSILQWLYSFYNDHYPFYNGCIHFTKALSILQKPYSFYN